MANPIGTRYTLGNVLGQGGMATVYAATDTQLGREVAIKVLRPDLLTNQDAVRRFEDEARTAAGFSHPHIARVYDVGDDASYGPFFVQELIAGQNLDALLPVAAPDAVRWMEQIASALQAIHSRGLIHCDIKPQNVRITPEGWAIVLDFGVAQPAGTASNGMIYGTPQYLAPERGQGLPPTPAADVYALGVMFYELLTGRVPHDGTDALTVVQRHIAEGVPALRAALPGQAAAIEQLIGKATERDPARRYPSVAALLGDLTQIQQIAQSPTIAMAPGKPPQRATVSIHNQVTHMTPPVGTPKASKPSLPPLPAAVIAASTPAAAASVAPAPAPSVVSAATPKARGKSKLPFIIGGLVAAVLLFLVFRPEAGADSPEATTEPAPVAQDVTVPSLIGLPLEAAQATASNSGLLLAVTEEIPSDAPPGQVLGQDPLAATVASSGATISIQISAGQPQEAPPPPPVDPGDGDDGDGDDDDDNDKGNDKGKGKGRGKKN